MENITTGLHVPVNSSGEAWSCSRSKCNFEYSAWRRRPKNSLFADITRDEVPPIMGAIRSIVEEKTGVMNNLRRDLSVSHLAIVSAPLVIYVLPISAIQDVSILATIWYGTARVKN